MSFTLAYDPSMSSPSRERAKHRDTWLSTLLEGMLRTQGAAKEVSREKLLCCVQQGVKGLYHQQTVQKKQEALSSSEAVRTPTN